MGGSGGDGGDGGATTSEVGTNGAGGDGGCGGSPCGAGGDGGEGQSGVPLLDPSTHGEDGAVGSGCAPGTPLVVSLTRWARFVNEVLDVIEKIDELLGGSGSPSGSGSMAGI